MLSLLRLIFTLVQSMPIFDLTPLYDITNSELFIDGLSNITHCVAFFLPVSSLLPIIVVDVSITAFHVIWSIILRIKSFIPTMGS